MTTRYLEIWEFSSGETIRQIDVTGKSEHSVEKVMRGMLINMNTDKFGVRDTGWEDPEPTTGDPR